MFKFLLILLLSSLIAASSPTFGLKSTPHGDSIKLDWVFMSTYAEVSYQELQYYLYYRNTKDHAVETDFYFPRDQDFIFNKFEATFDDGRIANAKIVDKEQSHTEPESSSEFRSLAVGKLQANQTVRILFSIIKPLKLHLNKFYEIKFPAITNQESPFIFDYDLKEWSIHIHIHSNTEINVLANPTHGLKLSTFDRYSAYGSTTIPTDKDFIFYFASKKDSIISQTPHNKEKIFTSLYPLEITPAIHPNNPNDRGFFLNFVPDLKYFSDAYVQTALQSPDGLLELQKEALTFEQRRRSKFDFHFLIDRSDSMKGAPFETLKKTLIALIQTLPQQSTIYLYSFGSTYEQYQIHGRYASETRSPNVKEAIKWIQTLEADMGEKNFLQAMNRVLRPNFEAPLIILTDGKQGILKYMSRKSALGFKIYSLTIGSKIPKDTLQEIGNADKFWSESVAENEDLGDRLIRLVRESASKPTLYFNVELQCKDFQEQVIFKKDVAKSVALPYDQAFNQWISLEESPDLSYCELNLEYFYMDGSITEKKSGRICHKNSDLKCVTFFEDAKTTDRYHKIDYHRKIRRHEPHNFLDLEGVRQRIINRSKQYQILSDFTSLVPVVVQENTQGKKSNQKRKNKRDIDL